MRASRALSILLVLSIAVMASGQAGPATPPVKAPPKPPAEVFIDPAKCGPDFALQGEYEGTVGADNAGCQVLALGKDAQGVFGFTAVFFKGGLPGAGWDGQNKEDLPGKLDGDKAVLIDDSSRATADGQVLTGTMDRRDAINMKKVVRKSPTLGAPPPAGAIVLFDGTNADAWTKPQIAEYQGQKVLNTGPGTIMTKQSFTDFTLHVEFLVPYKPAGRGQDRGNSGVYLQNRYEIQVLDSFALKGADNECGGIYRNAAPKVNMCFPPLTWQTYDIEFTSPKWEGDKKLKNAVITVKHNGVVIHENQEIKGTTGGGQKEGPTPGPIQFQGHGNPVFFRNVWIVEKK